MCWSSHGRCSQNCCFASNHFLPELTHLDLASVSKVDIAAVAEAASKMAEAATRVAEPASTVAETAIRQWSGHPPVAKNHWAKKKREKKIAMTLVQLFSRASTREMSFYGCPQAKNRKAIPKCVRRKHAPYNYPQIRKNELIIEVDHKDMCGMD